MRHGPKTLALLIPVVGLVFVILYGPIFVPIVTSFFVVRHMQIDWSAPTLDAYLRLSRNEGIIEAFGNTMIVGLCAVLAALAIGTVIALHYQSGRSRGREILQFVVFLPFLMPPIITGLSLLIFFREIDFSRSLVTIIIGHTAFILALVYRTVLVRLQAIGPRMIEASYDLGASFWQTFRFILLPNLKSALVGAAILAFALSFDETMITILVTGTQNTLPIRLWAMMRLGFTPDINALVALILALTTGLVLVAARQLMPAEFSADTDG
jgi:putative spermidine/putrescine transport system permease protein/spermidine/putrescine transport system permease protein